LRDKRSKFEDAELQVLLNENSARTFEKLNAEALNVCKSTVFDCLHAMGKIQKEGK